MHYQERRVEGVKLLIGVIHVVCAQAFYRWAMREIQPTHPDVPKIIRRQTELADKRRKLWACMP